MVCLEGESRVSLTKEDLMLAVQMFLNKGETYVDHYKVNSLIQHKSGGGYAVSVTVSSGRKKRNS